MNPDCAVIVVAGGKSTRMGTDKRMLLLGGKTFLRTTLEKALSLSDEVILVSTDPVEAISGVRVVFDQEKDKGPLMGLYTGLLEMTKERALVLPCDMPFISVEFLRNLMVRFLGYGIAISEYQNRLQPLCAVYSKSVIPAIETQLKKASYSVRDLLLSENPRTKIIAFEEEPESRHLSGHFLNVNTREDYDLIINLRALDSEAIKV